MRFIPKKMTPQDQHVLRHWPVAVNSIRLTYARWCEAMYAVGISEHVISLNARKEEQGQLILQTPFGDVVPVLTFVLEGGIPLGRVLLVRPADVLGRQPRAVFSVTISDDGQVYSGDEQLDAWPAMGANYGWNQVERFLQQLMVAVLEDDVSSTGYQPAGGQAGGQ